MKNSSLFLVLFVVLTGLLSACVPGLQPAVQAPTFAVQPEGIDVVSFSPPLLGSGEVVIRLPMTVRNPNAFSMRLARVDFDLFVNERLAVNGAFTDGLTLVPQGSAPLVLDVRVPLSSGLELLSDVVGLVEGEPTSYRLDGRTTVNVFDVVRVFATATLVSGRIN